LGLINFPLSFESFLIMILIHNMLKGCENQFLALKIILICPLYRLFIIVKNCMVSQFFQASKRFLLEYQHFYHFSLLSVDGIPAPFTPSRLVKKQQVSMQGVFSFLTVKKGIKDSIDIQAIMSLV